MADPPRGFASDNWSGAHPEVLEALVAANAGHAPAYGDDEWTSRVSELFRDHFGPDAVSFGVFNGTGANVLCIQAAARSQDAVICAETAHLNVDECGAPERIAGTKLLPVATPDGKLTPALAASRVERVGDQHAVQPRILSISQASELGTTYRPEEVRALAEFAHERDMLLHVDGARLANAAAFLDLPMRALTTDVGADLLSFGGTKNGLLLADAVVLLRPGLADGFAYVRKQSMQLASKMRFLSVQLDTLLGGDHLWLRNARRANEMAALLADRIGGLGGVELAYPVESNAVFAKLPRPAIERLQAELPGDPPFHVWEEERDVIRLMCSWDTTEGDVESLAAALSNALGSTV